MRKEIKSHYIESVDCTVEVEIMSRAKDIFDWLDEFVDNLLHFEGFDGSDECFEILYKDGTTDYISDDYDGHKIKRQNIKSMVYSNPEDYLVYGEYEMNEFGVAYAK